MGFNIEMRADCKVCHRKLPNARHRTYCSKKCLRKAYNVKYRARNTAWQKAKRIRLREEKSFAQDTHTPPTCTDTDTGIIISAD